MIDDRHAFRRHRLHIADNRADLIRVDRLDQPIGVVGEGLQARRQRADLLADFADALQRRVDPGRIIGQRLRELIDVRDRRMDRLGIVGEDLVGVVQNRGGPDRDGADAVQNILQLHRLFGVDDRRLAVRANQRRPDARGAEESDDPSPGQPLRLEPRLGVVVDRRVGAHVDVGDDLMRIAPGEGEMRDLADLDAVEQDVGAVREAGDRATEDNLVFPVTASGPVARNPHDEQKRAHDRSQGEGADQNVVGARLHCAQRLAFCGRPSAASAAGRSAAPARRITPLLPWK